MEEGEYVLEFESEHDEDFNMAALKMPGGHAHHHHGHGSGPFEWAGIFSITDVSHTWTMEKVDGSYADPSMRVVLIPTDTPTEATMHSLEDGVEALIEGDTCTIIEDGESMTPVDGGSCFEWHVGTGDISTFTIDTTGMSGFAAYTAHSPYEFEATQHYLKDSAGNDVEHVAEEGGGGHGDHGDHGDDHSDDEGGHDDEMCHNTETHENYESTEEECEAAGHVWMEDDHDDHDDEMCHNTETHENYESTEEECEAAGHVWMEDHEHGLPEIHADYVAHTLSFPEEMVCYDINTHTVNMTYDNEDDCVSDGLMWVAADSGPGGDDDHSDEEEHHKIGYVVIHIEEEGDYGFALPMDVEFYVLMNDEHDDHGHDDHDDHDDHSDEEDDHDDHSDDEDDHDDHSDEEIEFDPHSWLDPLAFKAQVDVVKDVLIANFPDHEATFVENAEAFKTELDFLHIGYQSAFGEGANCAGNTVVANHNAYSYLAQRYDIQFTTVHGLDPEGEPTAEDIAEVIEQIEEDSLTVLFVEEYTDQSSVAGIVEQTISDTMPNGISIEILYTMELPPMDSEDSYLTLMDKNLQNLKSGMGC
jgi:ABC-type Zn uptake system ZnuABC Zn-binding protein ZnuA